MRILSGVLAVGLCFTVLQPIAQAADEALPPPSVSAAKPPPRFMVRAFKVTGNSLLAPGRVEAAVAPLTGERSVDELKQAAAAVQALYAAAGYGAVVAFLPEQALDKGEIEISVLEGKLGQVVVTGNKQFTDDNIRAGLPGLRLGTTPRLTEVDAQIQLVNENPAKQVQVLLQPGQKPGEVQARVDVSEQPVQRFTVGIDNTGNQRTGERRLNLGWQHANVAGLDHVLTTQFQTSIEHPRMVTVASLGYRVPDHGRAMALDVYAAYSDVDGGSSATLAGDLQFAGKGRILGFRVSKYLPRFGELDQRLSAGFEHRAYLNTCQFANFGAASCGAAGESVAVQPLSIDYTLQRGGERPVGGSITLVHNLRIGGSHTGDASFDAVRPGAGSDYTLLRVSASAGAPLWEDWQIGARASAQASFQALVPGEQFGIGGIHSVRGYEERELIGDRGAFASIEVSSPELAQAVGLAQGSLRVLAFVDLGYVENLLDTPCNGGGPACSIASIGVGARWVFGPVQARLFVAHALKAAATTGHGDTGAHFTVNLTF